MSNERQMLYNSVKESPNYPKGFTNRQNGKTQHNINNKALRDKFRQIEPGKWKKVYQDGFDASGNTLSIHYFQSQSGKVFNVKVKWGWSN
jgi:filamentous hemagglutinin